MRSALVSAYGQFLNALSHISVKATYGWKMDGGNVDKYHARFSTRPRTLQYEAGNTPVQGREHSSTRPGILEYKAGNTGVYVCDDEKKHDLKLQDCKFF
jgi:hypothetical protein